MESYGYDLKITVFKSTGKYSSSEVVHSDCEMFIFEDKFKQFVIDNLPERNRPGGFVVVQDVDYSNPDQGFHTCLFLMDDLLSEKKVDTTT